MAAGALGKQFLEEFKKMREKGVPGVAKETTESETEDESDTDSDDDELLKENMDVVQVYQVVRVCVLLFGIVR